MARAERTGGAAAVFLDRDGTLIAERGPLLDPRDLELLPGVAEALCRLSGAGYRLIVITNQSAVGRGLLDPAVLERIHVALHAALAAEGAVLDGLYCCPEAPPAGDAPESPTGRRKPGSGMLLEAARDHGLDLASCWMIGDQARDTLAGQRAGCRGSQRQRTGQGRDFLARTAEYDRACDDLSSAADWILAADRNRADD
jgi:D-glycero-D-manno-heptose 1,7-bisphosphate phosphatase